MKLSHALLGSAMMAVCAFPAIIPSAFAYSLGAGAYSGGYYGHRHNYSMQPQYGAMRYRHHGMRYRHHGMQYKQHRHGLMRPGYRGW